MSFIKQEWKYILYSIGFAILWFVVILPYLISNGIENKSIIFQFIALNIGIVVFLQIFLKATTLGGGIRIQGTIGMVSLFLGLDTLAPPYMISLKSGELLNGIVLSKSATDYVWGALAINLGLHGIMVSLFAYVLMPFILLLIASYTLPNFVRHI